MAERGGQSIRSEIFSGRRFLVMLVVGGSDLASLTLATLLSFQTRSLLVPYFGGQVRWDLFFPTLALTWICVLAVFLVSGLYRSFGQTGVEEFRRIVISLSIGFGILALLVYFQKSGENVSRSIFLLGWAYSCILTVLLRFSIRNRGSLLAWWAIPVVVAGPHREAEDIIDLLFRVRRMGLKPAALYDPSAPSDLAAVGGVPILRDAQSLIATTRSARIQTAVFVQSRTQEGSAFQVRLEQMHKWFPTTLVVLTDSPLGSLWVQTLDLEGRLTLKTEYHLLNRFSLFIKRFMDIAFCAASAPFLVPVFVFIALLIKIDSRGPVFFVQPRLGRGGSTFPCLKFRTMVVSAEDRLKDLLDRDPAARAEYQTYHKLARDPRITRIGRFLRKFSFDELPQFWHVLTGDMSLVGPRAYMPSEMPEIGDYAGLILQIRPGLTGWWQVTGRHGTTFQQRLRLDEYYLSNWSPWLDIFIIVKTVWVLASGHGA